MTLPEYITFDCYGTLTDFDLAPATLQILQSRLDEADTGAFLSEFEKIRFEEVLGEYRPYREVLHRSLERAMDQFGLDYTDEDGDALVSAVPTFGPFPDVPPALERIRPHCKLVIISNTEDDLIAANVEKIGVPFHCVITAEQARAYKPTPAAFHYVLETLGTDKENILHVAQGFNYDIMPAHDLDWKRVWINRRNQPGNLAYGPYDELPDLSALPGLIGV